MGTLNKYYDAAAVEKALDDGSNAYKEISEAAGEYENLSARLEDMSEESKQNKTDISSLKENMSGTYIEQPFQHIETIDITTDGVSMLKRTNEPDGTPYNFKKILVRLIAQKGETTAAGQININSSYPIMWREDMISSASSSVSCIKAKIENGMLDGFCLLTKGVSERATPTYRSDILFRPCEKIETITVFTDPMSITLPIGSTIEIYAVRN